tara:strand:+ start:412 stop:516 length:105 start_codon:yes stop_codon:yes gene_type:complete
VAVDGVKIVNTALRAIPGAGGPYTSEFLRSKFEE